MTTPISKMNHPNISFKVAPFTRLLIKVPTCVPTTVSAMNGKINIQSTSAPFPKEPKKPTRDLMEMIIRDVPTAISMDMPNKTTSTGTIKKPPPAPTNPVMAPTTSPSAAMIHQRPLGCRNHQKSECSHDERVFAHLVLPNGPCFRNGRQSPTLHGINSEHGGHGK